MSQIFRESEERRSPSLWDPRYVQLRLLHREVARALEARLEGGGCRVVDLGAGGSPYEPLFRRHAAVLTRVDIEEGPAVDVVTPSEGPVPLADGSADLVVSFQVLEHVPDPHRFLAECRRILRPGGWLLLTTHGTWPYHPDPLDLHRWTGEGLRRLAADFAEARVHGVGDGLSSPVLLANLLLHRRLKSQRGVRGVLGRLLLPLVPLLNLVGRSLDRTGRSEELPISLLLLARKSDGG